MFTSVFPIVSAAGSIPVTRPLCDETEHRHPLCASTPFPLAAGLPANGAIRHECSESHPFSASRGCVRPAG